MTTIPEEHESNANEAQLGRYFDFGNASEQPPSPPSYPDNYQCPSHSGTGTDCLCHGFLNDWDVAEPVSEAANKVDLNAADYARFQDWIPRFVQPDEPCDYCRDKRLDCYMSFGKVTCTACDTLFRPCSFGHVHNSTDQVKHVVNNFGLLDTLHHVQEDACQEQGVLTGVKALKSKKDLPKGGTATSDASKRSAARFSRAAVKILREWLDEHFDHPYPSEEERLDLEKETGLKSAQISTWLANARRRSKLGKRQSRRPSSPSFGQSSNAINIPNGSNVTAWGDLNPIERWQHSPPENEPAPMSAIADAVASSDYQREASATPSPSRDRGIGSSSGSISAIHRAPSTTSLETRQTSSLSANSSAAWSGSHESFGSFHSFGSGLHGKRDRKRRSKVIKASIKKPTDHGKKRNFQCTFCTDTFKSKYDWTRHEKSLHLSLEKWICSPIGPVTSDPKTGEKICVYCNERNPGKAHCDIHGHSTRSVDRKGTYRICAYCNERDPDKSNCDAHNHSQCEDKGREAKTFYRKDHLRQHLRLVHTCELVPEMEAWKSTVKYINSKCGFCQARFTVWQERNDHLAAHFKEGVQMKDWKGCRGLDPAVAAQVINAMPPYLIGMESNTPDPFSATHHMTFDIVAVASHHAIEATNPSQEQRDSRRATCWEVLTIALGRFVKEQTELGVTITDEMLQREARMMMFGDDDPWNSTSADNAEWLELFKKAHGLDYIPSTVGAEGHQVPEDIELYGDLGMRVPFSVQLRQGLIDFEQCPAGAKDLLKKYMQDRGETQQCAEGQAQQYTAYSQVTVPRDRATRFATMALPTHVPGELGPRVSTSDWHLAAMNADLPTSYSPMTVDPTLSTFSSASSESVHGTQAPILEPVMPTTATMADSLQPQTMAPVDASMTLAPEMMDMNTMDTTAIDDFDFNQINFEDFGRQSGEGMDAEFHV